MANVWVLIETVSYTCPKSKFDRKKMIIIFDGVIYFYVYLPKIRIFEPLVPFTSNLRDSTVLHTVAKICNGSLSCPSVMAYSA